MSVTNTKGILSSLVGTFFWRLSEAFKVRKKTINLGSDTNLNSVLVVSDERSGKYG